MAFLEADWLAGQCGLFLAVFRAVVRHRETTAGGGAGGVLVAELDRIPVAAVVCPVLSERLGLHFRLCVHLDPLYSEFDHPSTAPRSADPLSFLRRPLSTRGKLLPFVRDPIAAGRGML